mmetsp:Transcript_25981/g.62386  ORF Transcript_25981/g.62386 Transcript_25981/m.62386 type:complete len:310 (+) Transcript_25981:339-1268(+)|eukprot:CAMPEP_0181121734 /NCGR_PEP_ID=MMETSP1071-20121207/24908_1 /TAXON_ID=35127 /ORGANISM="Thalassiosira sp., Strain NH16" /LENGTH=309 /DNA_ID=CAMNT_0023206597 /DNA_START=304 /DNA_END=1233 /DNA_ORIENTATION=+
MSNFFAALDDSDNEGHNPAPAVTKKKAPKKEVVEPSKVDKRPNKGDRNTKGGRGGRPPARDGKRTFDRRSGTGRGKEMKKGGGGGHNWGSDQNDAKKAEGPVTEGKEDANTPTEEATAGKEEATEKETAPVVEEKEPEPEEDNTMSYEEYLAQKATPESDAFKPIDSREVENEFAGKASSKKVSEDFLVMGGGKQPRKKGSGKKEKETLVMDFKIKSAIGGGDDRGDRGGRKDGGRRDGGGGRGGGRREGGRGGGGDRERRDGGRGRGGGGDRDRGGRRDRGSRSGGGRGGGGGSKALDTADASAFPSL